MQKKQRIPKNTKEQRTKKAKGASAYDEALYFLTPKARTVREVENRLDECNYSEGSRLVSCGYACDDVKTVLSELAENAEETGNSDEIPDEIEFSLRSAENGADDEE